MSPSTPPPYPPPPPTPHCTLTFPTPHIVLLTLNRPSKMNSLTKSLHWRLDTLWHWYDDHPHLRCAIITGSGSKAFCAGSDLLEIEAVERRKVEDPDGMSGDGALYEHPSSGFAGLSRRVGKKPVIAAVNGLALGGGFEIVMNCDISISSPTAQFSLPEPNVGVYASGGGLPRLIRTIGLPRASDIALTARRVSALEAHSLGLISRLSATPDSLLPEAIEIAKTIAGISPDAIIVTRAGLREAWERDSVERAFQVVHGRFNGVLVEGENHGEGLAAFREKRGAKWVDSKL